MTREELEMIKKMLYKWWGMDDSGWTEHTIATLLRAQVGIASALFSIDESLKKLAEGK